MLNSSIRPMDGTLLSATTAGQSGPGSNGNKGVLRISQSSSIAEASPLLFSAISRTFVEYTDCIFAKMQSVYSTCV